MGAEKVPLERLDLSWIGFDLVWFGLVGMVWSGWFGWSVWLGRAG